MGKNVFHASPIVSGGLLANITLCFVKVSPKLRLHLHMMISQRAFLCPIHPIYSGTSHTELGAQNTPVCMPVLQSCPTLCKSISCSPSGSSVHGILQAGMLARAAMSSSRGSSPPSDQTWVSCVSHTAGRFFTTEPRATCSGVTSS